MKRKFTCWCFVLLMGLVFFIEPLQGQIYNYTASLSGPAEEPPNASPGTGTVTVTINTTANTMRVQCTFSGLTGTTTASHIHAPTAAANTGTASVATQTPSFIGFPLGVSSGVYDNTFDMTLASSYRAAYITANGGTAATAFAALKAALDAEKAYFNVHSSTFTGGEIRGFLKRTWYFDYDKDGYGNKNKPLVSPAKPKKYVTNADDCKDWLANVHPLAEELPDNIDNDCDGEVDEGLGCRKKWYFDKDGDGYGNPNVPFRWSCIPMDQYVDNNMDCKDWDANVYPGNGCTIPPGAEMITTIRPRAAVEIATELTVYPNPARDVLMITLNNFVPNKKVELTLLQADGKVQQTNSLTPTIMGQQVRMDISRAAEGYYILMARQQGMTISKKVLVVR